AVSEGDQVIEPLNRYIRLFAERGNPVYFTRDWHTLHHISFKGYGGVWPSHCVQGTKGAEFHPGLYIPEDNKFVISSGGSPDFDSYSAFQGTVLHDLLRERGVSRVFVGGIATDYCVKHTVLGALNLGYQAFLLMEGVKGVNLRPDDSEKAVEEMMKRGAVCVTPEDEIL
ncbi:MAG: isochorismatase family protein, partial [Thermodesulfovibrionales bacterium]